VEVEGKARDRRVASRMSVLNREPQLTKVGAAVASSVLFVLAFPQYGSAFGIDWLVWFALVPFFVVTTGSGGWAGALLGLILGIGIEGGGFIWIYFAITSFGGQLPFGLGALGFAAWLAWGTLIWVALGAALGHCRRPQGVFWVLVFWVALEHFFPRLWPWYLGGAVYTRQWLVQNADLLGTSGLSALVFLANAVLYRLWRAHRGSAPMPVVSGAVLFVGLIGANVYGALRLTHVEEFERTRQPQKVMLVQGALEPGQRGVQGLAYYTSVTQEALRRRGSAAESVDFIVWPEGAIAAGVSQGRDRRGRHLWDPVRFDVTVGADPWAHFKRLNVSQPEFDVPLVAGSFAEQTAREPPESNVAVLLMPGATPQFYEKMERVPFGEVVPFGSLLREFGFRVGTIAAGKSNPLMEINGAHFRNLVCYEAILPDFVRRHADGAEMFVNLTEDIWYGRTAHISQHASVVLLRVVENRTPLVRCTNVGPSGVYSIRGTFDHGDALFRPAVLLREVRPGSMWTLYRAGGWTFPAVLGALALVRYALGRLRERK